MASSSTFEYTIIGPDWMPSVADEREACFRMETWLNENAPPRTSFIVRPVLHQGEPTGIWKIEDGGEPERIARSIPLHPSESVPELVRRLVDQAMDFAFIPWEVNP